MTNKKDVVIFATRFSFSDSLLCGDQAHNVSMFKQFNAALKRFIAVFVDPTEERIDYHRGRFSYKFEGQHVSSVNKDELVSLVIEIVDERLFEWNITGTVLTLTKLVISSILTTQLSKLVVPETATVRYHVGADNLNVYLKDIVNDVNKLKLVQL